MVAAEDGGDDEQLMGGASGSGAGGNSNRQHLSSDRRTFVNLLISFVGAGILGIPFAYRQVRGVWWTSTLTVHPT